MNTITTEVPFAVKENHMDINTLVKKYLSFLEKEQAKSDNIIEINFWKKGVNAKEVLGYLKTIND